MNVIKFNLCIRNHIIYTLEYIVITYNTCNCIGVPTKNKFFDSYTEEVNDRSVIWGLRINSNKVDPEYRKCIFAIGNEIIEYACIHANIKLLEWCEEYFIIDSTNKKHFLIDNISIYQNLSEKAYYNGHVNVIDWLLSKGFYPSQKQIDFAFYSNSINKINEIKNIGQIHLNFQWLSDGWTVQIPFEPSMNILHQICSANKHTLLQWCFDNDYIPSRESLNIVSSINCLNILLSNNIYTNYNNMDTACSWGRVKVLDWGKDHGIYPSSNGMDIAYLDNCTEVLDWGSKHKIFPSFFNNKIYC
ncbi:MAG: hypothetical protein JKX76_01780 [Colwellia sp.]|nr:hypothetical protein [Colwellia sp.]